MRSIKRHLPSRTFASTQIGSKQVSLELLISGFLQVMRERASQHFERDVERAVLGRPARFSNDPEADTLAEQRLRRAAELAGFREVHFCPEPLAAAYDFASDLRESRLVLVLDLGGGTSDFTLVRMNAQGFAPSDVLGVGGVAVAGDAIDGSVVRVAVAPALGASAQYRVPFGSNVLTTPRDLIELLCSPADLTWMDRSLVLRRLSEIRAGLVDTADRDKLDKFSVIVEDGVGFELYDAVESAKRALSDHAEAELCLTYPGAELERRIDRPELEGAAERPIARIMESLEQTLEHAGVRHDEVEIACMTGGTSRMPLIEAEERVHAIEHAGKFFRVRGPLNVPPSPQRHPLLVQAGSAEDGRAFAARYAEAVFTTQQTLADGQAFYKDLKRQVAALGRDPTLVKILPGIVPVIGSTEAEAKAREAELARLQVPAYGLNQLSNLLGKQVTEADSTGRCPTSATCSTCRASRAATK